MIDLRDEFSKHAREELPFLLGANCYQGAMGIKEVAVSLTHEKSRHLYTLSFHSLVPGFTQQAGAYVGAPKERVIEGCKADGLIDAGPELPQKQSSSSVIALLFSEQLNDFHFLKLRNDDQWESKLPLSAIEHSSAYKNYSGGYTLDRFFLKPDKLQLDDPYPASKKYEHIVTSERGYNVKLVEDFPETGSAYSAIFHAGDDYATINMPDCIHIIPLPDFTNSILHKAVEI